MELKIKVAIVVVSLLAGFCDAKADTSVYLGGWSKHAASSHANNNTQNAVILNYNDYLIGHYQNSYYGDSTWLVGYEYHIKTLSTDKIDVSLSPMITEGYRVCPGHKYKEYADNAPAKTCPIVTIGIKYTAYRVQPVFVASLNAVTFMLNVKF